MSAELERSCGGFRLEPASAGVQSAAEQGEREERRSAGGCGSQSPPPVSPPRDPWMLTAGEEHAALGGFILEEERGVK